MPQRPSESIQPPTVTKVRDRAGAVSPRPASDPVFTKARIGKQVTKAVFGPSRAVIGVPMNLQEKRNDAQEMTIWPQHLVHVASSCPRTMHVFEDLIRDDEIKTVVKHIVAHVEFRKIRRLV